MFNNLKYIVEKSQTRQFYTFSYPIIFPFNRNYVIGLNTKSYFDSKKKNFMHFKITFEKYKNEELN